MDIYIHTPDLVQSYGSYRLNKDHIFKSSMLAVQKHTNHRTLIELSNDSIERGNVSKPEIINYAGIS